MRADSGVCPRAAAPEEDDAVGESEGFVLNMEQPSVSYFLFSVARALVGACGGRLHPYGCKRDPAAARNSDSAPGGAVCQHSTLRSTSDRVTRGLDNELLVADTSCMGRTKRSVEVAYLDPDKHALLKQLARQTRIPKTVLVREAIDDLLVKHGVLKPPKRKLPSHDSMETR